MAWVRTRLSARGLLDASPQRGGFACLTTRLSSTLKSSRVERTTCTLRTDTDITKTWDLAHKTRVVISAIKTHTKQTRLHVAHILSFDIVDDDDYQLIFITIFNTTLSTDFLKAINISLLKKICHSWQDREVVADIRRSDLNNNFSVNCCVCR